MLGLGNADATVWSDILAHTFTTTPTDLTDGLAGGQMTPNILGAWAHASSQEASERISAVLQSSTEYSIIAIDPEGVILHWNQGAQRVYGYTPAEVIGKPESILHVEEDFLSGLPQAMMDRAQETGMWKGWVTRVRKGGGTFADRVALIPHRGPGGELIGFLLISRDAVDDLDLTAEFERSQASAQAVLKAIAARVPGGATPARGGPGT
jgi:PAS domain S-box-containing protein